MTRRAIEFYNVLVYLESVGRLKYGYKGHTSHSVEDRVLYLDCWGTGYVCGKIKLSENSFDNMVFCSVGEMEKRFSMDSNKLLIQYNSLESAFDTILFSYDDFLSTDIDKAYLFVENNDELEGSDHVYKIVRNLVDIETGVIYEVGLLGMSSEGLQTEDASLWFVDHADDTFSIGYQPI